MIFHVLDQGFKVTVSPICPVSSPWSTRPHELGVFGLNLSSSARRRIVRVYFTSALVTIFTGCQRELVYFAGFPHVMKASPGYSVYIHA
jgi:hypothetical protein